MTEGKDAGPRHFPSERRIVPHERFVLFSERGGHFTAADPPRLAPPARLTCSPKHGYPHPDGLPWSSVVGLYPGTTINRPYSMKPNPARSLLRATSLAALLMGSAGLAQAQTAAPTTATPDKKDV